MSDIAERIASLPPEKRALLAARLAKFERPAAGRRQIPRREQGGPAPLSYTQQRIWFLDQLYPENVAYNSPIAIRFTGRLDVDALERSWNEVIRRHDLLRAVFELREGIPAQRTTSFRPVSLRRMDLSRVPGPQREEAARLEAVREARQLFNLTTGPIYRAKLLCCGEEEHILVVTLHHIVCDGWSTGVLVRELVAVYEAYLRGEASPLPELPIQYADYAAWQQRKLAGSTLSRQIDRWKARLDGCAFTPVLPLQRTRPAEQSFNGARMSARLPAELLESLRRIGLAKGATLFMTLLAAFKTLLFRYSGQTDIVVGSQFANRDRMEFERLIGFFANTLALRTDLSGDPAFLEVLERVRDVTLDAYNDQDVPFEKLVEKLEPERQLNRNPFFDISFSLQNLPMPSLEIPDLRINLLRVDNGTSKFDLSVVLVEDGQGLVATIEYSTDLFDPSTPERLLRHYRTLLEGIVAGPERRLSDLPLLDEQERRQVMVEWNQTARPYRQDRCIHDLFEASVSARPDAVAVDCEGATLSYAELEMRSGEVARQLRRTLSPGECVAVCIERSPEMIAGLLGILKAGAAYVPMDPTHPQDRLAFIMADAGARKLLTGRISRPRLEECAAEVIRLDREVSAPPHDVPAVMPVSPDSLAYVIYTSGSTGQPKGVEVTHRSVVNLLNSFAETPGIAAADTLLALTTLSFDISVAEIFLPLSVGARIILAGDEAAADVSLLKQLIEESQPTIIQATPSRWRLLLEAGWRAEPDLKIFCAGEALPRELGRQLTAMSRSVWNLYGPTETTVFSGIARVEEGPVHVGRPIANTRTYILDANSNPAPVGVPGELYIGGLGVSRGYRNRPQFTAEKFLPDPFGPDQEGRLFRTGDAARYLRGGEIEYLGRLDNQVKIRGFRIELGEVECVLRQHPSVAAAVAVLREDHDGEKQLAAYFVPAKTQSPPHPAELAEFLGRKLPDYMTPSAFVALDVLPLTLSGKIDRKALPDPDPEQGRAGFVAPRDEVEKTVAEVWSAVLKVRGIGIHDDFFHLGGHSMLATRAVSRLRDLAGIEIPLLALFENPTIAAIGEFIRGARCVAAGTPGVVAASGREELEL